MLGATTDVQAPKERRTQQTLLCRLFMFFLSFIELLEFGRGLVRNAG